MGAGLQGAVAMVGGRGSAWRQYRGAVAGLAAVSRVASPRGKLTAIRDCLASIARTVEMEGGAGEGVYIEPDDLIPIICCLFVAAKVPYLIAELNFCSEMVGEDDRMGELGCHLVNMHGAASVLLRLKL